MLLETLDIKIDDIVIYSQNLFNQDNNFRIVYKDDVNKVSHKISFSEVCRHVNEFTPKNLIVYRLLTNIKDFEIYTAKYGFFLNINGIEEMIFFDPVYAVRELEEYSQSIDYNSLRFRIQQIGLTTLNRKGDFPNYAEIYSIDLEATEAKFQNDKVFADAIFSKNKNLKPKDKNSDSQIGEPVKEIGKKVETLSKPQKYYGKIANAVSYEKANENNEQDKKTVRNENSIKTKSDEFPKQEKIQSVKQHSVVKIEQTVKPVKKEFFSDNGNNILPDRKVIKDNKLVNNSASGQYLEGIRIVRHDISEDKYFDFKEIMKINIKNSAYPDYKRLNQGLATSKQNIFTENESNNSTPKMNKYEEVTQSRFGKFLKDSKNFKNDKKVTRQSNNEKVSQVMDIFKSSSSSNDYLRDRAGKQIVLKLDKT
jgi:hypothetical protein